MEAPLPHLPSQLNGIQHVAYAERVLHQHGEVLRQGAVALCKRLRHFDGQSDVFLTVGLPHDSELFFSGVIRFLGSNFYPRGPVLKVLCGASGHGKGLGLGECFINVTQAVGAVLKLPCCPSNKGELNRKK